MSGTHEQFIEVGSLSREGRMVRGIVRVLMRPTFALAQFPRVQRTMLALFNGLSRLPKNTVVRKETILGMPCEWIASSQAAMESPKTILYFHGGGFVCGNVDSHREFAAHIAHGTGARVLLPEYRLAPENPFPSANDDCLGIYRWLLRRGVSAGDVLLGGDSAGGCLAIMTLLSLRDAGDELPAGAVMFSPATDCLDYDGESYRSRVDRDPWFSPAGLRTLLMHYADTDHPDRAILSPCKLPMHGLPPLLILVGDAEILLSDSQRLAERAAEAGVKVQLEVWEHMWHDFPMFAGLMPEARDALGHVSAFARAQLGLSAEA